jgi:tetratricopeptide (TPR) repeat protein
MLNERLGRSKEAEEAYARAIAMLEELVSRYPHVALYQFKLVETYDIADPWSADSSSLELMEHRLRRAGALIDQLASEEPRQIDYAQAQIHVQAKLGMALQRLERPELAETCYHRAIALQGALLDRAPGDGRTRFDRATTRHALATLLFETGRSSEGKALLTAAADELRSIVTTDRSRRPPPELFERLADAFGELGETDRAEEMLRLMDRTSPGPPRESPSPAGRVTGAQREAAGPL